MRGMGRARGDRLRLLIWCRHNRIARALGARRVPADPPPRRASEDGPRAAVRDDPDSEPARADAGPGRRPPGLLGRGQLAGRRSEVPDQAGQSGRRLESARSHVRLAGASICSIAPDRASASYGSSGGRSSRRTLRALEERFAPAVIRIPEPKRLYPLGAAAGPLIGSTGVDGQGLLGLEARYERDLHGVDGKMLDFLSGHRGKHDGPGTDRPGRAARSGRRPS